MSQPLNKHLYHCLKLAYGDVRITSAGEAFRGDWVYDASQKRYYLAIEHKGEQYNVCCPICKDTRYRLQFHHLWGCEEVPDLPHSVKERLANREHVSILPFKKHLVYCFNEDCYADLDRRNHLFDYVFELGGTVRRRRQKRIGKGVDVEGTMAGPVDPPGHLIRVDRLPARHPAVQYLESRFWDVSRLARTYGVSFCKNSPYYLAQGRIIIPIRWEGKLRSWQARHVGEIPKGGPPKYFTCPNSAIGRLLYNLTLAKRWKTAVVTEGVTDVWQFGPMACSYFKQKLSMNQILLLRQYFREGSIVLLPDAGEEEQANAQKAYELLDGHIRHGVAVVDLKSGDPGSLDRRFLREFCKKEAKAQGVKVFYAKR